MPGHADTSSLALELEPGPSAHCGLSDIGGLLTGAASQDGVGDEGVNASLEGIPMKDRSVVAAAQLEGGRNAPTKRDLTLDM